MRACVRTLTSRHGKGRQTFGGRIDGMGADVYEGDWADGKRCGEGTMQYANGDVFQGCWDEDDKHGEAGPRESNLYSHHDLHTLRAVPQLVCFTVQYQQKARTRPSFWSIGPFIGPLVHWSIYWSIHLVHLLGH